MAVCVIANEDVIDMLGPAFQKQLCIRYIHLFLKKKQRVRICVKIFGINTVCMNWSQYYSFSPPHHMKTLTNVENNRIKNILRL